MVGTYTFIDANLFKSDLRACMSAVLGAEPTGFDFAGLARFLAFVSDDQSRGHTFDVSTAYGCVEPVGSKVFWYDAMPAELLPRDKGEERDPKFHDKQLRRRKQIECVEKEFAAVRAMPGWHVRAGTFRRKGKGRRESNSQKEVDVLLACDALNHAFRRNTDRIILVSGDLDFRPVIEQLVQLGVFVTVLYDQYSRSSDLIDAADDAIRIPVDAYYKSSDSDFQKRFPFPQFQRVKPPELPELPSDGDESWFIVLDLEVPWVFMPRVGWCCLPEKPEIDAVAFCERKFGVTPKKLR